MTVENAPLAAADASIMRVELALRGYDIVIGDAVLPRAASLIAQAAPDARAAIVTDETVAALHLPTLTQVLSQDGRLIGAVQVAPGEASKSVAALEDLCERLLALGVERGDVVVALGGGVVGDLAGFAAAILRRGVRHVQIPTTLLAQVDSSVGGKTGINSRHGKNLLGAFHQPCLVIADIGLLTTLPERQFRAGYAEMVKYGFLGDAGFFAWLEDNRGALFAGDPAARVHAVERCIRAKAAIVAADERETGERALLNLGHTFGHALEAFAGYSDRLLHGEAIAIGMGLAFGFSHELGLCPAEDRDRAWAHLGAAGLPVRVADMASPRPDADTLMALMAQDKKVRAGRLALVLVRGIGRAFVAREVPLDKLRAFLDRACEGA